MVCNFNSKSSDLETCNPDHAVWQLDKHRADYSGRKEELERPRSSILLIADSTSSLELSSGIMQQLSRFRGSTIYTMNNPMVLELQADLVTLAFSVCLLHLHY
jgi:hypothetical protein